MIHPKALTIAGSDSGGGAGIQADLKTFSALGVYGASVITSITAQNTLGVFGIQNIAPNMITKQIDAVMTDIRPHAVKTGMLSTSKIISAVASGIQKHKIKKLVVDPVMVAKSGDKLLQDNAVRTLKAKLLPLTYLLTPNIPEAEVLTGLKIRSIADMEAACRILRSFGPRYVVIKGGHRHGEPTDVFFDGKVFRHLTGTRFRTKNTHGTGCTFSAAITAQLSQGATAAEAVMSAKRFITDAIRKSYPIGKGHGPVHHFFKWYL